MAEDLIGRNVRGDCACWEDFRRDAVVSVLLRQHLEFRQLPQETDLVVRAGIPRRFARRDRGLPFQVIVFLVLIVGQRETYWRHRDPRVRQRRSQLLRLGWVIETHVVRSADRQHATCNNSIQPVELKEELLLENTWDLFISISFKSWDNSACLFSQMKSYF